jgi:hypothetical protein
VPAISDRHCVHIAPRSIGNSHCLKLVDLVYLAGGNAFIIAINCSLDELSTVMNLKTLDDARDDALVIWLDMGSKIWLEVLNSNALKIWRDNMAREVVLQEKYFPVCFLQFLVPLLDPILIQLRGHPHLCIVPVIKSQLAS